MSQESNNTLQQCLHAVWQRTQRRHAAGAALAFARWFIPLVLSVILIDRLAYLPGWLRAVAAVAILAVALIQAWRQGGSRLRRFEAMQAAQQIEDSQSGLDSLLFTALQFQQQGATPGTSAAMWELAQRRADEAVRTVAPQQVVPMKSLQKPLRLVLAIAGIFLLLAILKGPFLAAGFGRLFTPWLAIVYPTNTQIDLGSGDLVIQEGSPAVIQIGLSGQVPKTAELALRTGEGRPREINLEVKDGLGTYQIAAASRDFSYRVKAGDARSDWRQVRVIAAPRMAKVAVELDFPEYIERPNETVEALTLTVPEETKVRWQITLDTPIREAKLQRDDAEDLPLEIGADGRTLTLSETASASRGYSFSWTEQTHGFTFTSPRYFLQVASDQAPRIELTQPVANINAMLGRPLTLAVRMQDDHGIGATRVIYRVNNRPEKTVELPTAKSEGEQTLDWDYRKEITDLQVGDSVSFLVEVTDKYPGEGGAHTARTDTRRITFLSREDYLAEVTKQMERLLTRVRTLYRQQRAAHDLAVSLDPAAESYLATCQLEAIRQEMVCEQLVTTADEVQALLDDLAANQVTDALESASLATLRDAMRTIANNHVARAADLLRTQVGAATRDPRPATAAVNQAARELGNLVLLRGIDAAREVFARETTMLAKELARVRLRLHQSADQPEALAKNIEEIATWTDQLFDQLTKGTRYDKRPLAVLGLSRRIHDLRKSKLTDALRSAAAQTRGGKSAEANAKLYPLIRPLLEAEFTMRSGAEYAVIRSLREQLTRLISAQEKLLTDGQSATDFTALAKRQTELRDALLLTSMSRIPAPRAGLLDITLPPAPPSDEKRLRVESLMTEAVKSLQAQSKDEALTRQREALAALRELDGIVTRWSVELAQNTLGVSAQVSDASDRISVLEELETRAIGLIEQIEEVALDEKDPAALTEAVVSLRGELDAFQKELAGEGTTPAKEVLPLLSRVESASKAMSQAVTLLSAKKTEDAIEPQEAAATALTEARTIAEGQLVQFNLQQQLIGFQQAVSNASNDMADVVGGQNDLITATQKADEKQLPALLAPQRNLLQCLTDIAPTLDVVAARLDVGTPLVFAASDVEDALLAMEDGDGEDAAEIQETAVESLAKVQGLVSEIAVQTGYVTEIVEFLHNLQSDGSMLAFRQRQLREQNKPQEAFALQQALAAEAKAYGEALSNVAGRIDFQMLDAKVKEKFVGLDLTFDGMVPVMHMNKALSQLQAGEPATETMQAAEKAFAAHSDQVNIIIAMLNGLPGIILTKAEPPELHRLIAVLDTASKHRALLRRTHAAAEKDLPSLATAQQNLADAVLKSNQVEGLQHPMLAKAHEQLTPIVEMLKSSNKAAATAAQLSVDQTVRHFIIEQALILNTAVPPASSSDSDVLTESETDDLYFSETVGEISEFVSGEAPKDKKSEWEILGERNRAALNQNFARELPLEFRATLKNYYERVAK